MAIEEVSKSVVVHEEGVATATNFLVHPQTALNGGPLFALAGCQGDVRGGQIALAHLGIVVDHRSLTLV
jgi:hypothetical protein